MPDFSMQEEAMRQSEITAKRKGFDTFMSQPAIRLLISTIPTGERPETLETLLTEAFNAGFQSGSGNTVMSLVKTIFERPWRRPT